MDGVIGWSHRILGADITILQYFLFKFPFPKQDYAEMKSLQANLLYCIVCYWCLRITSSFEDLGLALVSEQPCCSVKTDREVEIFLGM